MRVRPRRIKSYIPGTIIGTTDRYLVSVGTQMLLMGEYPRLPIYEEVSLILVSLLGRHLTKQLSAGINHHSYTQPLKEHKGSPQRRCKPSHSAIKRCYTQGEERCGGFHWNLIIRDMKKAVSPVDEEEAIDMDTEDTITHTWQLRSRKRADHRSLTTTNGHL
jgi:hypothetical protein